MAGATIPEVMAVSISVHTQPGRTIFKCRLKRQWLQVFEVFPSTQLTREYFLILTSLPRSLKSPALKVKAMPICHRLGHHQRALGLWVSITTEQRSSFRSLEAPAIFDLPNFELLSLYLESYVIAILSSFISPSPVCWVSPTSYPTGSLCSRQSSLFPTHSHSPCWFPHLSSINTQRNKCYLWLFRSHYTINLMWPGIGLHY